MIIIKAISLDNISTINLKMNTNNPMVMEIRYRWKIAE